MESARLEKIETQLLDDHPDNPRIGFREDVISGIVANLSGEWPQQYALHVRQVGDRYQVIAGHHRKRAAEKAGLAEVWCWVEELDDDAAYMALATSNNQGELSPLEIGFHVLRNKSLGKGGRGKKGGLSKYAEQVGKDQGYVTKLRQAAEVLDSIKPMPQDIGFHDKTKHLSVIHSLPKSLWQSAVELLAKNGESVKDVEARVEAVKAFLAEHGIADQWQKAYLVPERCAEVVYEKKDRQFFARLSGLADRFCEWLSDKGERGETALSDWTSWLEANAGGDSWAIDKCQAKRMALEELVETEPPDETPAAEVLLADPPWQYDFAETDNRKIENQYPTATVDEICGHLEEKWAPEIAEDCVLYLWATAPKLREALQVMDAWGFEYKTHAVWDKEKIGSGYWFRGQHELLLVGTRGEPFAPQPSQRVSSVFREKRTEHSVKPRCVYEAIEGWFPEAVKCEMYQRKARSGWHGSGNEAS